MEFEYDPETGSYILYSELFDYMSVGRTKEDALVNFEKGLHATIVERIKVGLNPIYENI